MVSGVILFYDNYDMCTIKGHYITRFLAISIYFKLQQILLFHENVKAFECKPLYILVNLVNLNHYAQYILS